MSGWRWPRPGAHDREPAFWAGGGRGKAQGGVCPSCRPGLLALRRDGRGTLSVALPAVAFGKARVLPGGDAKGPSGATNLGEGHRVGIVGLSPLAGLFPKKKGIYTTGPTKGIGKVGHSLGVLARLTRGQKLALEFEHRRLRTRLRKSRPWGFLQEGDCRTDAFGGPQGTIPPNRWAFDPGKSKTPTSGRIRG